VSELETADAYGDCAEVLAQCDLSPFRVYSKFTAGGDAGIGARLERSLARLGLQRLEGYSFHDYAELQACLARGGAELAGLKASGRVRAIGVSVYTDAELRAAAAVPWIDLVQLPFNLLDNHHLRGEGIAMAKAAGKTVHARSPFLQGLFFMEPAHLPPRLAPLRAPLEGLHAEAARLGLGIGELAMGYALSQPGIDGVVFGVDSFDQLAGNLDSWARLDPQLARRAELPLVAEAARHLLLPPAWKANLQEAT
jgi:aryl-alcohol dehydrogenase-like predicted oxidoreductase